MKCCNHDNKKHKGSCHWVMQRLTAIALIPLSIWLLASIISLVGADAATAADFFKQPLNAAFAAILIIAAFIHKSMGLEVILQDYVHCPKKQKCLIGIVKLISLVLAVLCLASIYKLATA